MTEHNKRQFTRVKDEFKVRITKIDETGDSVELNLNFGKSFDVSATGLSIHVGGGIKEGDKLKIKFLKPHSFDFFDCNGKVIRIIEKNEESELIAIQFTDLTDSDIGKLNYYLTLTEEA